MAINKTIIRKLDRRIQILWTLCQRKNNKWKAVIGYEYRRIDIGRYDTEQEAALAYNEVAKKLHGSFAVLNQVQQH